MTCSACATFYACRAGLVIRVYAFDNSKGALYHGPKSDPDDSFPYGHERLEKEHWVALSLADWEAVRVYCKVGN